MIQHQAIAPVRCRQPLGDADALEALEAESIALLGAIQAAAGKDGQMVPGWQHSQVESRYSDLAQLLMSMPGYLRRFRRTFIAGGRVNFPDAPQPKPHYLEFDHLPGWQAWRGRLLLLRMLWRLFRHHPFTLAEVHDRGVGEPLCVHVPSLLAKSLAPLAWVLLGRPGERTLGACRLTEAQIRFLYYRLRLEALGGKECDTIIEIGGGFGGLCGELMQHWIVRRYIIVELPESVPLCYFYLKALLDAPIQVLYKPGDVVDPEARIVVVPPWILPFLEPPLGLAINTMSFQHMNAKNLRFYFRELERIRIAKMYLVNRNQVRDPEDVIMDDYPIPAHLKVISQGRFIFGSPALIERFYATA
jgi:hypothetical protein